MIWGPSDSPGRFPGAQLVPGESSEPSSARPVQP